MSEPVRHTTARALPLITTLPAKSIFVCARSEIEPPRSSGKPERFRTAPCSPVISVSETVMPSDWTIRASAGITSPALT